MKLEEYNPNYKPYIDLADSHSLTSNLTKGMESTVEFFKQLPSEKQAYRYAEGKWTPKEILLHLVDTERVFSYRALQFARSKNTDLVGFDQDEFVANSAANNKSMNDLLKEYRSVRMATVQFFDSCDDETLLRMGKANGSPMSVRAAGAIICGHEIHHANVIKERY